MIARLRGTVWESTADRIVLDCGGVGYEIAVPEPTALAMGQVGQQIELFIRHVMREDGSFLFGFSGSEERDLFDMLREVKGCGPKTSLALIGMLGSDGVVSAISQGNHRELAKAPGIGPRLAERIAVDLRDKVANLRVTLVAQPKAAGSEDGVVQALMALGYRQGEAEAAAAEAEGASEAERIRDALKRLSK